MAGLSKEQAREVVVYWRNVPKSRPKTQEFYSAAVKRPVVLPSGSGERFRTLMRKLGYRVVQGE
jgi:hypothetical protein